MKLSNVLSTVGRPRSTVHLPELNLEVLAAEKLETRGRPFGRRNSKAPEARTAGRPTKEESLRIMFERIETMIVSSAEA